MQLFLHFVADFLFSTWCPGADRFSALFVADRVCGRVFMLNIKYCKHHTKCAQSFQSWSFRLFTWSWSVLIMNSSRVCFGFLSELGEINIFKIFRRSSSWSSRLIINNLHDWSMIHYHHHYICMILAVWKDDRKNM